MFSSILELLIFTAALCERDWLIDVVMGDDTAKLLPLFLKCFAEGQGAAAAVAAILLFFYAGQNPLLHL